MKKLILAAMVSSLLVGCGGGDDNNTETTPTPPPVVDPAPDLDVDGDFGVDHEPDADLPPDENTDDDFGVGHDPEEPEDDLPPDENTDDDFGVDHEDQDPDFGLDHGGDDTNTPDLPDDDGLQIFDPAVDPEWIHQANDVTFDKKTGNISGTVVGKNVIGEAASALISVPIKSGTTLGMYNVEWEIDTVSNSHMNIYLNCEGTKRTFSLYQDGYVEEYKTDVHYSTYEEFKTAHSSCTLTQVFPDALIMKTGNFIWRSSDSRYIVAGEPFLVKKFSVTVDQDAALPDENVDDDFSQQHPVDVEPVVDVSLIKQANDISVDTTNGYVSGVVKGTSILGKVSPAIIAPVIQADTTLSQYDVEWDAETTTNSYMSIKLDCAGTTRNFGMRVDGTVSNPSEGGQDIYNSFADFKEAYGSCAVTLAYPGDGIARKSNFIWMSSNNAEVVAGATFTIKKFNVTFTAE